MYFVDRNKIEETLQYLEEKIALFETNQTWSSDVEKAALERIVHMMVDSFLDVGNSMIDGFIMRDPGSFEDIVDILEDEKVITQEMAEGFKRVLPYRKALMQSYININHGELQQKFQQDLVIFKTFPTKVREYILHELGPVTAFKS